MNDDSIAAKHGSLKSWRKQNIEAQSQRAGVEFWRVDRVARYLDISKKRVYQLVQEKRLQAIRLGPRQMRISRPSLDAYLADLVARSQEEYF